jgi:uncharacterized protein YcgL (UPF0745 family)
MKCAIYKSHKRANTYLYVSAGHDLGRVPKALLDMLGRIELVMTLELTPQRTLAHADPAEVRRALQEQGYFLQLPPADFPVTPS